MGVSGRAPGVTTITFTPLEFFGAAARCSHLHTVNPLAATSESFVISALVEQHVDDITAFFFVEQTADNFKDFIKSYFAGTVAAGLAYLQMTRDGYAWADHFENIAVPLPAGRNPDFVFSRAGSTDVALMESKGSRSAGRTRFDATVERGYLGQVAPHLGSTVGSSTASHGFCIGSWLTLNPPTPPTTAELYIHHTAAPPHPAGGGSRPVGGGSSIDVQRGNYATALTLAHGEQIGSQVRRGNMDRNEYFFWEFEWSGHSFVTRWPVPGVIGSSACRARDVFFGDGRPPFGFAGFALERERAKAVLNQASSPIAGQEPIDLQALTPADVLRAREDSGALFPDGFAVIGQATPISNVRAVMWTGRYADFQDFKP